MYSNGAICSNLDATWREEMKMTHWSKTSNIVFTQRLVKRFNGRFVGNPINYDSGRSFLTLTFDHVENANSFSLFDYILSQPFA